MYNDSLCLNETLFISILLHLNKQACIVSLKIILSYNQQTYSTFMHKNFSIFQILSLDFLALSFYFLRVRLYNVYSMKVSLLELKRGP